MASSVNQNLLLAKYEKQRGNLGFPLELIFVLQLNFLLLMNIQPKNFLLSNVLLLDDPKENHKE